MFKKFVNGLIFGLGFAISLVIVFSIVSQIQFSFNSDVIHENEISIDERNEWHDLTLNEKIEKSSAIAIIRFKQGDDNIHQAYVEGIYLKDSNIDLEIKTGDRIEKMDFYTGKYKNDRNGEIIFYTKSPGIEMSKSYLYDDRLIGFGDMPLELFLIRFKESKVGKLKKQKKVTIKNRKHIENFFELPIEDKIINSTAILLTEYQRASGGDFKSIIIEILKKEEGVDLFYEIGDEYDLNGGADIHNENSQAGYVVFMDENPAKMRAAMSYSEKGIRGLDNISLELLREKCETR